MAARTSEERLSGRVDGGNRDAESVFRSKPISEIRKLEASTRDQIYRKKEELRQLVGNRYRDLIDAADSIVLMKSSSQSVFSNIAAITDGIGSLSMSSSFDISPKLETSANSRARVYLFACRVKYLVDTPENIWGCLDERMFLEAAARCVRSKLVHTCLENHEYGGGSSTMLSRFPLLHHQRLMVESFKSQISQRSRERLFDQGLGLGAYADALAAVAVIDELVPKQVLGLFLDTRKAWISQKLCSFSRESVHSDVVSVFCGALSTIQVTIAQVGELFLQVLSDLPLYYKVILGSPPVSQLFGGIVNPENEVKLWTSFRDMLEAANAMLDRGFIASTCLCWLKDCGAEVVGKVNGRYLIDEIKSGYDLASAERLIRETVDSKDVMEGSLVWIKSVFGSVIEFPWRGIRELVLSCDADIWDEIFEDAFVQRMKEIIVSRFNELTEAVNVMESIRQNNKNVDGSDSDFEAYLNRDSNGGGVWFMELNSKSGILAADQEENGFISCLNAYFGGEVSRIRNLIDSCCESVLSDLLRFLESPKASLRLTNLSPYVQNKCYDCLSDVLTEVNNELGYLHRAMGQGTEGGEHVPHAVIVERSLFIGRLLFSIKNHSKHIPIILGSPRFWVSGTISTVFDRLPSLLKHSSSADNSQLCDTSERKMSTSSKRHTSMATNALLSASNVECVKFEELDRTASDIGIRAHGLWTSWVSDEVSRILRCDLQQDKSLSTSTPLKGWEETIIQQDGLSEGQSEIKISLPLIPSLYIMSFLFRSCKEIHQVGGHVLEKSILQKMASTLLQKVIDVYEDFITTEQATESCLSDKGILQVLLDLRFAADVLSGGDFDVNEDLFKGKTKSSHFRQNEQKKSVTNERVDKLINLLSHKLDPIDWQTYQPYLWENARQSYLRNAVLFGFFVQLNRMHTGSLQKLPSNSESNILRCSAVPRFKYLPISAPAFSSKGFTKASASAFLDDVTSKSNWKVLSNGEVSQKTSCDDKSQGLATPLLKSFMQVGSRFGESGLKLGSILTEGHVGRFGDILPAHAAGLFSSFTASRSDS